MPQDNRETEPHRWGSLNGSLFHRLVADLYSGLGMAGLGKYERRLIDIMVMESWTQGFLRTRKGAIPEPVPVELKSSEIADRHGYRRSRVSEAIASLVCRKILVEVDGGYLINKTAREWLDHSGHPALSVRELEICVEDAGKTPRSQFRKSGIASSGKAEQVVPEKRNSDVHAIPEKRNSNSGKAELELRNTGTENSPPQTPIEERAREEEKRQIEENTTQSVVVAEKDEERHRRESILQVESGLWSRGLHGHVYDGPHEPDRARLEVAFLICDRLDLHYQIPREIEAYARVWPSEWFVLALKYCHHTDNRPGSWKYLRRILEGWQAKGRPQAGEWDFLDDGLKAIPLSARTAKAPAPAPAFSASPNLSSHRAAAVPGRFRRLTAPKETA